MTDDPNQMIVSTDEWQRLTRLETRQLREEFADALSMTASQLVRLAAIVRILEERGEDLSTLKTGMLGYLRRIAYGQVLPEVIVRFSEYPSLVNRISNFPLSDQKRLAEGEPVPLLVYRDGSPDLRMVDPLTLSGDEVQQIFARDHVRTDAEQAMIVSRRKKRPAVRKTKAKADPERNGIRIGRSFAPLEDVLSALAELAGADFDDSAEGEATIAVKVTAAQHQQLKVRAAKSQTTMAGLVMRAMAAGGLLSTGGG